MITLLDANGTNFNNQTFYAVSSGGNVDSPGNVANTSGIHRDVYFAWNSNNYVEAGRFSVTAPMASNVTFQTNTANIMPGSMTWIIGSNSTGGNVETQAGQYHRLTLSQAGTYTFQVQEASSTIPGISIIEYGNTATTQPTLFINRQRGTIDSPVAVQASDSAGQINFSLYNGSNSRAGASIFGTVRSNATIASGNTVETDLFVRTVGNIYFGTQYPNLTQSNTNVVIGLNDGNRGNISSNVYYGNKAFLTALSSNTQGNVVYYNSSTGELTYQSTSTVETFNPFLLAGM